jgi:hypothetical protein
MSHPLLNPACNSTRQATIRAVEDIVLSVAFKVDIINMQLTQFGRRQDAVEIGKKSPVLIIPQNNLIINPSGNIEHLKW